MEELLPPAEDTRSAVPLLEAKYLFIFTCRGDCLSSEVTEQGKEIRQDCRERRSL